MSAGTIALTNNSANVTGTGTAFTTDLKGNDFIVVIVGGVTYTLGVKATTSATALTLITPYNGPTATGNAWTAVPNATLVGITAQVAADVAKAIRGLNLDKANWQQVFSGTGTITVTLPDGSTYTGPAWNSITASLTGKADKVGGAVPVIQGGTGATTPAAAINNLGGFGTAAGNIAQGNDSRLNTVNGKTGGAIVSNVSIEGTTLDLRSNTPTGGWPFLLRFLAGQGNNIPYVQINQEQAGNLTVATGLSGTPKYFSFLANGNMQAPGNITCASLTQTSDETKKDRIEPIVNALGKINTLDGVTFLWKESGLPSAGIIAQQIMKVLPESVSSVFDDHDEYGEVDEVVQEEVEIDGEMTSVERTVQVTKLIKERDITKRSYSVEYSGVVALLVEAVKELSSKVSAMETFIGPDKLAAIAKEEATS
ncbi:tail fiber domain-containing protein [Rahnella aquatilis]|uniref:tail fiber domain-containing protein n=1 Tax=Rahnella aquatilis TaxID=34038 RepID=UPI00364DA5A4